MKKKKITIMDVLEDFEHSIRTVEKFNLFSKHLKFMEKAKDLPFYSGWKNFDEQTILEDLKDDRKVLVFRDERKKYIVAHCEYSEHPLEPEESGFYWITEQNNMHHCRPKDLWIGFPQITSETIYKMEI